jgi:hypothetical protein
LSVPGNRTVVVLDIASGLRKDVEKVKIGKRVVEK